MAARFLTALMARPRVKRLLSSDHFSVDGTMIQAWSSIKSIKPTRGPDDRPPPPAEGRNPEFDCRGQARTSATLASTTDPEAKLYRKRPGMEARLAFLGPALMENRHGLVVDACLTKANGHAERLAALAMIEKRTDRPRAITLGADKSYHTSDFVNEPRAMNVRPHVARHTTRRFGRSAVDGRTTRHPGYAASQRIRKRIDEAFGWMKTIGGMRRPMQRGAHRVGWAEPARSSAWRSRVEWQAEGFTFVAAAYNIVRLPKLMAQAAT